MTLNLEEFRKYLTIDKTQLDDELAHQSSLLYKVADEHAEAVAERDDLKEKLSVVDAELDAEVRKDFEVSEEKYTEAQVKAGIQTDKKHRAAYIAWAAAKKRADKLFAMKESFKDRGFMVRDLCSLYVANYYEQNSVRSTNRSDTAAYATRRERMAEQRVELRNQTGPLAKRKRDDD